MRQVCAPLAVVISVLLFQLPISAQPGQERSVPRVINITGVFRPVDGQPPAATEIVTLAIYADAEGGAPLWQETQTVALDDRGRYSLMLGASQPDGIPAVVFASGAQWLATRFERPGGVDGARVRLTSVPYALRAADADTLGGRPASDYQLAPLTGGDSRAAGTTSGAHSADASSPNAVLGGTPNFLAKYVNAADVGNSGVFEAGGTVGIGTTTPFDFLHVRYTNTNGGATGIAVQNLGNTATSYSGMLFYDQNGALGQFQGFNNVTHEYRINNIARNAGSAFDGSINFMTGSTSRLFVGSNGGIGIGTTVPAANLEVSNGLSTTAQTNLNIVSYGANALGSTIVGRKARGTAAAPSAVAKNDTLLELGANGFGSSTFGSFNNASISMLAAQDWVDGTRPTMINFSTTADLAGQPAVRMTLGPSGNLGIGTSSPATALEISRTSADAVVRTTTFTNGASVPAFFGRAARGTPSAPAAPLRGDVLAMFGGGGYDGAFFTSTPKANIVMIAAENWTPDALGTAIVFDTTPIGTNFETLSAMAILPNGNVGIGTPRDVITGLPTATDKLQVFGDISVGTTGTNGCLKDFSGTGIAGTCSSDRRLKKDITPFEPVLNQLTSLQPVHYFWRTSEFPERHFGNRRADGLIAQDVEQVLPALVETDSDGYKAVNYSKLPLLTIQAVKELKAENDTLTQRVNGLTTANEALAQRLAELERLVADMLAATGRR